MEVYVTEEQQVEAVKNWLKRNGPSIALGIVLGIAVIFGVKWYRAKQVEHKVQASVNFDAAIAQLSYVPADKLTEIVDTFSEKSKHIAYENLLALASAKKAVEDNDLQVAEGLLSRVVAKPAHPLIEHIARARLARVQMARQSFDAALQTLQVKEEGDFAPLFSEIRGDIYLAQGDSEKAHVEYQKAVDAIQGLVPTALRYKLADTKPATEVVKEQE